MHFAALVKLADRHAHVSEFGFVSDIYELLLCKQDTIDLAQL